MNPEKFPSSNHFPSANERQIRDYQRIWDVAAEVSPTEHVSHSARWESVWETIDAQTAPKIRPIRRAQPSWYAYGIAAGLMIAMISAWVYLTRTPLSPPVHAFAAEMTAQKIITLQDGSKVRINSGSTLTTVGDWSDGQTVRQVKLEGEGFFEVAHHPQQPFVVETFNATIRVLGTKFNVRARKDDQTPETRVFLQEGKVDFGSGTQHVTLKPGEWIAAQHGPQSVTLTAVRQDAQAHALAWTNGRLAFSDQPIGDILQELTRRYGVTIQTDPATAAKRHTLLLAPRREVASVLDDLCLSAGLRYRSSKQGYEVFSQP